jgi:hypothetical protein
MGRTDMLAPLHGAVSHNLGTYVGGDTHTLEPIASLTKPVDTINNVVQVFKSLREQRILMRSNACIGRRKAATLVIQSADISTRRTPFEPKCWVRRADPTLVRTNSTTEQHEMLSSIGPRILDLVIDLGSFPKSKDGRTVSHS